VEGYATPARVGAAAVDVGVVTVEGHAVLARAGAAVAEGGAALV
jgi:hypothetical protein